MTSPDETASVLGSVPQFAAAGDDARRRIMDASTIVDIEAGDSLVVEDDPADAAFLVLSGLFEIVARRTAGRLRLLGRGALAGELAVITRRARSASMVALRPSSVLRIPADTLMELVSTDPAVQAGMIEGLAQLVADSRAVAPVQPLERQRVAVIDATGRMSTVVDRLTAGVCDLVTTCVVEASDNTGADAAAADRLVYVVRDPLPDAVHSATRVADRVLVLVDQASVAPPAGTKGWAGYEPVAVGEIDGDAVTDAVALHHLDGPDDLDGIARLARRLAGRSVGLALSAGGARALAHIGVVAELEEAGIVVDRISACSMGALVGSLYASGHTPLQVRDRIEELDMISLWLEHGPEAVAVGAETLAEWCGNFTRDFSVVSVDLARGGLAVHTGEHLAEELAATMALPGLVSPRVLDGAVHVDGTLINPLPADILYAESDGPVIAVDVNSRESRVGKWSDRVRREGVDADHQADVAVQAMDLASVDRHDYCRSLADMLIDPEVPFGTLAFGELDALAEAGRLATRVALDRLDTPTRSALGI